MRLFCLVLLVAAACGAIFKPSRKRPPDEWSREAAALHAMVTVPQSYIDGDCSAAPLPYLQLFCEKKCDQVGELSLKAYCNWECDDIKNPDLGVMCKLELRRAKNETVRIVDCDAIEASALAKHCRRWVASLPQKPAKKS